MRIINEENALVIKSWCNEPEEGAIEQARHLARLPFAFRQINLMPDTHQGYGMPIGGVLATEGVVIPNAVGVDIGCGMCAVKTNINEIDRETLKKIMGQVRKTVPVGFAHHNENQERYFDANALLLKHNVIAVMPSSIVRLEWRSVLKQVGTLGGGNHFIEIQKGDDGHIWIMVHSGSRNLGKQVADHYNRLAVELNEKYHSAVPKAWQLAFLPLDTEDGERYVAEMNFCIDFAFENRQLMMKRIQEAFPLNTVFDPMINIAHNYARMEHHFGKNVMVHRKGATSARQGEIGIIPGSQGSSSYIVRGKGNPESFESCSHGAGRRMGRKAAIQTLSLEEEIRKMDEKGIVHGMRNAKDLDEASGAYKDIDVVMAEQADLVEPVVRLEPLAVIKG